MFASRSGRQHQGRQGRGIRAYERVKPLCFKVLEAVEKFKTRVMGSQQRSRETTSGTMFDTEMGGH